MTSIYGKGLFLPSDQYGKFSLLLLTKRSVLCIMSVLSQLVHLIFVKTNASLQEIRGHHRIRMTWPQSGRNEVL